MPSADREISCRVTRTLLMYMREQNSGSLGPLVEGLDLNEQYLLDTNNWVSHAFLHVLYHRMIAILGDENSVYKFALASGRLGSLGLLDGIARLLGNPKLLYSQAPRYNKLLKLNGDVYVRELSGSSAVIEDRYHDSAQKTRYDCDYTRGVLTAMPTIFGLPPAFVEEIECQVAFDAYGRRAWPDSPRQGAAGCLYKVRWAARKRRFLSRSAVTEVIGDLQEANAKLQDKYDEAEKLALDLETANRRLQESQGQLESNTAELRASEERYRFLADNVSDIIWTFTLDTMRFTYASPSVEKIFGFTPEEVMQRSLEEILSADSAEAVMNVLREELSRDNEAGQNPNRNRTVEIQQRCKDGSYKWAEATTSFIRNEEGRPLGVLGVTRDISERKRIEAMIAEQLKAVQFLSSSATRLLDPMPRRELFTYLADRLREVTGRAITIVTEYQTETNQIVVRAAVGPDDRIEKLYALLQRDPVDLAFTMTEDIREHMSKGRLVPIEGGVYRLAFGQLPSELCRAIEERLEVGKIYAMSFVLGEDFLGAVVIGAERTEELNNQEVVEALVNQAALAIKRRKTEEALRKSYDQLERKVKERTAQLEQSNERHRDLAELLPEMVYEADEDGQFTYANRRALETFGYSREDLERGMNNLEVIAPADHARLLDNAARIARGERSEGHEYTGRRKDGSEFPILIRATRIERAGRPVGFRGVVIDLTASRKAEEEKRSLEEQLRQAEKLEAIGTLAGGIAHDFNNMLAVILGNAELALDEATKGANGAAHRIEQIVKASKRARDLVRQILMFSRKSERQKKALELAPLVTETIKFLRGSLPSTITIRLDSNAESATVLADPSQIQQILLNLAANAAHAMSEGGALTISLSEILFREGDPTPDKDMRPGRYVKLSVHDTGTGIPKKIRDKIFDPFFTTKESGQGTGMGLAVVYGIVRSHGAAITVDSKPGKGSTFNVFFPASEAAEAESDEGGSLPTGKERVLIVDDEPAVAEIESETLKHLGYDVTIARSGGEGWNKFEDDPRRFDLVLTDHVMPEITGMRLAERMLEVRKGLPIVLITGYGETVSPAKAREAGISALLIKPVAKKELAETVRRALDRRI